MAEQFLTKVTCWFCDGEKTVQNSMGTYKCDVCDGIGILFEETWEDSKPMAHKWIEGEWGISDVHPRLYKMRKDRCELCAMERTVMMRKSDESDFIEQYNRSGIIFRTGDIPECWGSKNPT